MRQNHGRLSAGAKILSNLVKARPADDVSVASLQLRYLAHATTSASLKEGINIVPTATDGVYLYYDGSVDHYVHFRQRHLLVMTTAESGMFLKGDDLFGKSARHDDGSWPANWRLTTADQFSMLISYIDDLPELKEQDDDGERTRYIEGWVRQHVFDRDQGKCQAKGCNSRANLHYDHIIPFSRGGGNYPNNIRLLCASCNLTRSTSHRI